MEQTSAQLRVALIERLCAEDTALLREARKLIGAKSDDLEDFAQLAGEQLRKEEQAAQMRKRIGAYAIVRELGRGGMGTVYLAERADGQFQKQVAIKVLRRGTDTDEVLRRFKAEREILARLEHPNIARLLDAGTTDDGLPYFIMECIAGNSITRFVQQEKLSLNARIQLFLKICSAVEYAHGRQIIHRDIKSSNVLVSSEGEPKLLDFGIAKLVAPTENIELTGYAERRLTAISASPEQILGQQVTRATDIYSLGVLLYELLTEQHPHHLLIQGWSQAEVTTAICLRDAPLPSVVVSDPEKQKQLAGALDEIIRHAMRKDPAKRYTSICELGEDIRRYLAGEPIIASRRRNFWKRVFNGNGSSLNKMRPVRYVAALIAIAFVTLAVWLAGNRDIHLFGLFGTQIKPSTETTDSTKSIAVLPFDAPNEGEDGRYFVEGVQDNIVTDLGKIPELRIISRSATARYKGRVRDLREIGRALGVNHILEGSVQRSADRLRVNAQLIDARNEREVWAEHYDRTVDDLFAIQAELADKIAGALHTALAPGSDATMSKRPTTDREAYDLYLRARAFIHQYGTPASNGNNARAAYLLERAVARDPSFALGYSLLSEAHLNMYRYDADRTPERLSNAKTAVDSALRLAPTLPEAHIARARYTYYGLRDYKQTLSQLSHANSTGEEALFLASLAERRLGRWKESLRDGEKAASIDPGDPFIATGLIETYIALHRFADAEGAADRAVSIMGTIVGAPLLMLKAQSQLDAGRLKEARKTLEAAPPGTYRRTFRLAVAAEYEHDFAEAARFLSEDLAGDTSTRSLIMLTGAVLARAEGDDQQAQAGFRAADDFLETVLRKQPADEFTIALIGVTKAGQGRKEEALRASRRATELVSQERDAIDGPLYQQLLAIVEAWTGDKESALQQLFLTVKHPCGPTYGDLRFNPMWDDLRSDPRFDSLVAEAQTASWDVK
jgi:serine/threonine protein kinase/TolB-like protein